MMPNTSSSQVVRHGRCFVTPVLHQSLSHTWMKWNGPWLGLGKGRWHLGSRGVWTSVSWVKVFDPPLSPDLHSTPHETLLLSKLCWVKQLLRSSFTDADVFALELIWIPVHLIQTLKGTFCIWMSRRVTWHKQPWEWDRAVGLSFDFYIKKSWKCSNSICLRNRTSTVVKCKKQYLGKLTHLFDESVDDGTVPGT